MLVFGILHPFVLKDKKNSLIYLFKFYFGFKNNFVTKIRFQFE